MIREVHDIIIQGKNYKVGDLLWSDFLLLYTKYDLAIQNILSEFNEVVPQLNRRQAAEMLDFLLEKMKKHQRKAKNQKEKEETLDITKQFIMIEGQLMQHFHQPLSEIRTRTINYVMELYSVLPEILGYTNDKNEKPDKKKIKQYLGKYYQEQK